MSNSSKDIIAEQVESGRYFSEARIWYNDIFIAPSRGAALSIGAILVASLFVFLLICNIYGIFPLSRKVNTVVFMQDTIGFYPKLEKIAIAGQSTRYAVAKHLCQKYIQSRESYDRYMYHENYKFVLYSSTQSVFDSYYDSIKIENPESPLLLYSNSNSIDGSGIRVEILSYSFDEKQNLVSVKFNKKFYNNFGEFESESKWVASMRFYMSDYDFSKSTNSKLNFIITEYVVKEIKG